MPHLHPCLNDKGQPVVISIPSTPSALAAWQEPAGLATVVPGGPMPDSLNGIPLAPWAAVPDSAAGWMALAEHAPLDEPPFEPPAGMRAAAGAVVVEDDGRVWLVSPSNGFGGYSATFPKGRADAGDSLHCTAIREVFEEAGLQVRPVAFLVDVRRTLTFTRYYIARRIGGTPAAMGWETQAVHLVPAVQLEHVATHQNDCAVIRAAQDWIAAHLR